MTWFDTKNGQRLLDLEEAILTEFLEDKFGYYALQTNSVGRDLLKKSRMKHHLTQEFFKELFRITIPEGRVVIFSFNPFSFAGLRNLTYFDRKFPWNTNFASMGHIQRKLKESGFSIEQGKILDYQPLFSDEAFFSKTLEDIGARWLPLLGNIYFIVAKKEVPGVTPLRPKWNKMKTVKAVTNK